MQVNITSLLVGTMRKYLVEILVVVTMFVPPIFVTMNIRSIPAEQRLRDKGIDAELPEPEISSLLHMASLDYELHFSGKAPIERLRSISDEQGRFDWRQAGMNFDDVLDLRGNYTLTTTGTLVVFIAAFIFWNALIVLFLNTYTLLRACFHTLTIRKPN